MRGAREVHAFANYRIRGANTDDDEGPGVGDALGALTARVRLVTRRALTCKVEAGAAGDGG